MELKKLTTLVRDTVDAIDNGGPQNINELVQPLRDAGITPKMHVGKGDHMDDTPQGRKMVVEWYAGSLLDIVDSQAWHCVNSIINCKDKFAPVEYLVD